MYTNAKLVKVGISTYTGLSTEFKSLLFCVIVLLI
jgi:hypothetical protein